MFYSVKYQSSSRTSLITHKNAFPCSLSLHFCNYSNSSFFPKIRRHNGLTRLWLSRPLCQRKRASKLTASHKSISGEDWFSRTGSRFARFIPGQKEPNAYRMDVRFCRPKTVWTWRKSKTLSQLPDQWETKPLEASLLGYHCSLKQLKTRHTVCIICTAAGYNAGMIEHLAFL